ncbi:hypothetical protein LINPERPRIM_LOCUS41260 [Linum perenne]
MKPRPPTPSTIPTKLTVNFVIPYATELSMKEVQTLLVQVLMWIHLLTLKIMKKKAVKLKFVKRMMVQVRWKDLFDRWYQSFVVPNDYSVDRILEQIMAGLTLEEQQTLYMKLGKRWKRWLGLR